MNYIGVFWGYRERDAEVSSLVVYSPPPIMPVQGPGFEAWMMTQQSYSSFRYRVITGLADDDYPDDFIMVDTDLGGMTSRQVMISVFDNPVDIITTYDGVTELSQRYFEAGFVGIEAIRGFKVRNFLPGRQSAYQVVAFT